MTENIRHDEDLEELANSKKASALREAADIVITAKEIQNGSGYEKFFEAAMLFRDKADRFQLQCGCGSRRIPCCGTVRCSYISLHDSDDMLLFFGTKEQILDKVRALEDREPNLSHARCIKSLYKTTYEADAFTKNCVYPIVRKDELGTYVLDNAGQEFGPFTTRSNDVYYVFSDYFVTHR